MSKQAVVSEELYRESRPSVQDFIQEYEDYLLGRRKTLSAIVLSKNIDARYYINVLRVIFEKYLHWDMYQVLDCLTPEIVKKMKLAPI